MCDSDARLATTILQVRLLRSRHLPPELFSDYPWDLLLVLFIADADGEKIDAVTACRRANVPEALGHRWLKALFQRDLIACEPDCGDRHLVALSPAGIHAVERCIQDAREMMDVVSGQRA